jgi:hypothetical protein
VTSSVVAAAISIHRDVVHRTGQPLSNGILPPYKLSIHNYIIAENASVQLISANVVIALEASDDFQK